MSETEQVKSEDSQPIKPEVKPKNPKRVEAGKKGAEARRLKKKNATTCYESNDTHCGLSYFRKANRKPNQDKCIQNIFTSLLNYDWYSRIDVVCL